MYKRIVLLFLILSLLFTTACWDKVELNDRTFVISLGIDKYNKKNDKSESVMKTSEELVPRFSITMVQANISSFEGKGGGSSDSSEAKSVKRAVGSSIASAVSTMDSASSRRMYFGHTKLVVLGEELLRDSQLLKESLDSLEREEEFNRKIIMLAASGSAFDIVDAEVLDEPLVGFFVSKFYKNSNNSVSSMLKLDLGGLLQQLRSNKTAVIPRVILKDKKITLDGLVVLSDYKLADSLSSLESRGYMWIKGHSNGTRVTTMYEDVPVPCRITSNVTDISFSEVDDKLNCNININCNGNIEEYIMTESLYDDKTLRNLGNRFSDSIMNDVQLVLEKLRYELNVDALDLRSLLKKKNYKLWEKYNQDWDNVYRDELIINTNVTVNVRNIGAVK